MTRSDEGEEVLEEIFEAHRGVLDASLPGLSSAFATAVDLVAASLAEGGAVLSFGNGGSAAEAQHLAGELTGRFRSTRGGLRAVALTADPVAVTAIANDFGYEQVFARQVEAVARPGDVVVALSTSGTSPNVVAGARAARARGCRVVALTGRGGGDLAPLADACLAVASQDTPRIQELHLVLVHALVEAVERRTATGERP